MAPPATPFFLTFVRDLPLRSAVVGGEQIRPLELVDVLGARGVVGEVWCVAPSTPRSVGPLRIRRLPLPRWGPARELLSVPVSLAVFLLRVLQHRRNIVLYQRVAGGIALKGRIPFAAEPGWLFFGLARILKVTVWASMHDLSPDHELNSLRRAEASGIKLSSAEQARTRRLASINEKIQRWTLARASVVSVVSESLRVEVKCRYKVDDHRIFVIRAGFNPGMIDAVTRWVPPVGRRWTAAYVGSRYDLEMDILLEAIAGLEDQVELLLAGRGMDTVESIAGYNCRVVDASYSDFASLANEVDIWIVPIAEDPYLNMGWHLKLPMDVATGRPVVLSDTDELRLSGLAELFFVAERSGEGIRNQVAAIVADPAAASERAERARKIVNEAFTWDRTFGALLEHVGLTGRDGCGVSDQFGEG